MKTFLPLLLAFLLCFAGGMRLHRPVDPAKSLAAMSVLAFPEKPESYDRWVNRCQEDSRTIEMANVRDRNNKARIEVGQQADELISKIKQYQEAAEAGEKLQEWHKGVIGSEVYRKLKEVAHQASAAAKDIDSGEGNSFQERMTLYEVYQNGLKNYNATLEESGTKLKLKELANTYPPEPRQ
ncbi:MAG: hypothetical protein NTW21_19475 [Verrucomicrobia bacterium]|nr:hypothetical protein [Verrucomicrobiota bacterium]